MPPSRVEGSFNNIGLDTTKRTTRIISRINPNEIDNLDSPPQTALFRFKCSVSKMQSNLDTLILNSLLGIFVPCNRKKNPLREKKVLYNVADPKAYSMKTKLSLFIRRESSILKHKLLTIPAAKSSFLNHLWFFCLQTNRGNNESNI